MSWTTDTNIRSYMNAMRRISKDALPEVAARTLNSTAEDVRDRSKKNVENELTVRTKFTLNSIRQDRHAKGHNIERMYSRVGTISDYLPIQEEGGTVKAEHKFLPIPTVAARIGSSKQRKIRKKYYMNSVQFGGGRFFMGKPKGGDRPLGIWERTNKNTRLKLIRLLGHRKVEIPATHWFSKAIKKEGDTSAIQRRFIETAKMRLRQFR